MIRQAISCDICGTEKRQTNHWFVAYEQAGELRIGGWTSRQRLRSGAKHLCGQTCLHKLVDEFIAQSINLRPPRAAEQPEAEPSLVGDTSLTSAAAYPGPGLPGKPARQQAAPPDIVTMPSRPNPEELPPAPAEPRYSSQSWRAAAWERERERELHAVENRPDLAARRRSRA